MASGTGNSMVTSMEGSGALEVCAFISQKMVYRDAYIKHFWYFRDNLYLLDSKKL
jgi:hypothetical protein